MPNEHSASNKKSTHCENKKLLKTWKEGINYNSANTKGGTDGQTWRRLKQISSGRDDRIGAKIKTQKNPPPQKKKIPCWISEPQNFICRAMHPGYVGITTNLQNVLNNPKKSNFPTQKNPKIENFNPPPPPKILWSPLPLEILSATLPLHCHLLLVFTVMPLNIIKIKTVQ